MSEDIYIYTHMHVCVEIYTHTHILDNKSVGLSLPLKGKHFKLDL